MLEIKNVEVFGLDRAMIASGNPMTVGEINTQIGYPKEAETKDVKRAKVLGHAESGSGHDNYLSGIQVMFDVKYPQYWSMEFQRYHFAQIVSSQSKMHCLIKALKEKDNSVFNKYVNPNVIQLINGYVETYNIYKEEDWKKKFIEDRGQEVYDDILYEAFMRVLSNLPMGYQLWMTVTTNYLQLKTIYAQRKNHKLKEDWGAFIKMCDKLPMFIKLTQKENDGV